MDGDINKVNKGTLDGVMDGTMEGAWEDPSGSSTLTCIYCIYNNLHNCNEYGNSWNTLNIIRS